MVGINYLFANEALISVHTASVTCLVLADPPKSRVTTPLAQTASTQSNSLFEASSSPSQASISAAVQKVATGFEMPWPVMSKAEP